MRERADAQPGDAEIWQAVAPNSSHGVTVTATRSSGAYQGSLDVVSYIGASTTVNGSVATQSGASGAPSVSLTTTANDSWVWGVGNDWDNAVARTIGPNQTLLDQFLDTGTGDTYWTQYQTGQSLSSGAAVTINDTTPTGDSWNLAAIEIVPSGGSTPPPPPPPPVLPSVPTNLSATAVNGSLVDLSWTASTDVNGVDGYDVYRNGSLLGVTRIDHLRRCHRHRRDHLQLHRQRLRRIGQHERAIERRDRHATRSAAPRSSRTISAAPHSTRPGP